MIEEKVLYIGGPYDGRWMVVHDQAPAVEMWDRDVSTSEWPGKITDHNPVAPINIKALTYCRAPIKSGAGQTTYVYVLEGLDPLEELINGYRKP